MNKATNLTFQNHGDSEERAPEQSQAHRAVATRGEQVGVMAPSEHAKLAQRAAELGCVVAQTELGVWHLHMPGGEGVERDDVKAVGAG